MKFGKIEKNVSLSILLTYSLKALVFVKSKLSSDESVHFHWYSKCLSQNKLSFVNDNHIHLETAKILIFSYIHVY